MDRREFLACIGAASIANSLGAADLSATFPSNPRDRLSVSTYPFRSVISRGPSARGQGTPQNGKPGMGLADFAASIREQFGVPGIEPWSHHFQSIEPAYLNELRSAFQKAQVRVVNIPCDVHVNLCGSAEELSNALDTYAKWVDAAVLLGSPSIRVHIPRSDPPTDFRCAVDGLKAVADYGEKNNIVINLENDDPATENPDHVLKVIQAADTPFLRALPDFGNSRQFGDEEYNEKALAALFPHAFNISHVKDSVTVDGKVLSVDIAKIFEIANNAGYRGYFSMEWDSDNGDPYAATKQLIAASTKALS